MSRSKPWEIAADLETAAKSVRDAGLAVGGVHATVCGDYRRSEVIDEFLDGYGGIAAALQALSNKYQAIADAEPEL